VTPISPLTELRGFTDRNGEPVSIYLDEYCTNCIKIVSFGMEDFPEPKDPNRTATCFHCNNSRKVKNKNGEQLMNFVNLYVEQI